MTITSPNTSLKKQNLADEVISALFPNALKPCPLTSSLDSSEPSLSISTSTDTFSNMSLEDMSKIYIVKAEMEEMTSWEQMWMSKPQSCDMPKIHYGIDYASDPENDTTIGSTSWLSSEAISEGTAVYISSDGQVTPISPPKLNTKDHFLAHLSYLPPNYIPYLP